MATNIRRLATLNEVSKLINDSNNSWFATVCYVKIFKPKSTMRSINGDDMMKGLDSNRLEGDDEIYNRFSNFKSGVEKKLPFQTIINIKRFQFVWLTNNSWNEKYGKYKNFVDDETLKYIYPALQQRLGREPTQDELRQYLPGTRENNPIQQLNYGQGGRVGASGNATGKKYFPFNEKSYRSLGEEYYGVDYDGHIIGRIPNAVGKMFEPAKTAGYVYGAKPIRDAGGSQENVDAYIEAYNKMISDLRYLPAHIIEGQILYMAAAMANEDENGELMGTEKVLWFNEGITNHFEKYNNVLNNKTGERERKLDYMYDIDKEDLLNIAKSKISKDYGILINSANNVQESILRRMVSESRRYAMRKLMFENRNANKRLVRLTEGDLHRIIRKSVNRVLNESIRRKTLREGRRFYRY